VVFVSIFILSASSSFNEEDVSLPGLEITEEHVNRSGSISGKRQPSI
jgi:hypothetical protein